jgi:hypothetical protein
MGAAESRLGANAPVWRLPEAVWRGAREGYGEDRKMYGKPHETYGGVAEGFARCVLTLPGIAPKTGGSLNQISFPQPGERRGVEHTGVIDLLAENAATDRVELVMFEPRPWDGGEDQLFQLQEKLNAYMSFALDGEMAEAYPNLTGKPLTLVLRCMDAPPPEAVGFLAQVREQIALQGIELEVLYARETDAATGAGSCGHGCGCHSADPAHGH